MPDTVREKMKSRIRGATPTAVEKDYGQTLSPSESVARIEELCAWLNTKAQTAEERYWSMAFAEMQEFGEVSATPLQMADAICASAEDDANEIIRQFAFLCGQPTPGDSVWAAPNDTGSLHAVAAQRVTEHISSLAEIVRDMAENPNYEQYRLRRNIGTASPWAVRIRDAGTDFDVVNSTMTDALEAIFNSAQRFLQEGLGAHFPSVYTCGIPCADGDEVPDNWHVHADRIYPAQGTATVLDYPPGAAWHEVQDGDTMYVARLDGETAPPLAGTLFTMASMDVIEIDNDGGTTALEKIQLIGHDPAYPLSGYYRLEVDIDGSGASIPPIREGFTGVFDGNGHTIEDIEIDPGTLQHTTGLFRSIRSNAMIRNLTLEGCVSRARFHDNGLLVGLNQGTILNCHAESCGVTVSPSYWGGYRTGGLVGYNFGGTIRFCSAETYIHTWAPPPMSSELSVQHGLMGGFVGRNDGTIEWCHTDHDDTATHYHARLGSSGHDNGGFVGTNIGTIRYCVANTAGFSPERAGAFAGINHSLISHCHAAGSVEADQPAGFVYTNHNTGSVIDCYTTAEVTAGWSVANGFVRNNYGVIRRAYANNAVITGTGYLYGFTFSADGTLENCFYNDDNASFTAGQGEPKTDVEMQTQGTFTNFDFDNTWEMSTYPVFHAHLNVGGETAGSMVSPNFGLGGYGFGEGFIVRKIRGT